MNIECRFSRECDRFQTDDCNKCLHNRRRNAPRCFYDEANDSSLADVPQSNGVYFAMKGSGGLAEGAYLYVCPACNETITVGRPANGGKHIEACAYCGLPVIVMY
jgi:hypothetical protein